MKGAKNNVDMTHLSSRQMFHEEHFGEHRLGRDR